MNVNGVTSTTQAAATYSHQTVESEKTNNTNQVKSDNITEPGVIYEPSGASATTATKKTYKPDTDLINKLKADADARTQQLRDLVEKMMGGQAQAYGKANDIWSFLREGNFTVDPATKLQAQQDIAEDGYWGVKQTSSRILDFAKALTGGDPSKIEAMRDAFQKGYEQAEKIWGGELPDISKQTYEAVMKGFDDLAAQNQTISE